MKRLLVLVSLVVSLLVFPATAQENGTWRFGPTLPEATGNPHPEGNEYMRKFHKDLMKHDRDLTVREGVRDIDASLKQCFDCHTVTDEETGDPVTYEDDRHFCKTCHQYVAVQIDCFMCHRSTPADFDETSTLNSDLLNLSTPDVLDKIEAYVALNEQPPDK